MHLVRARAGDLIKLLEGRRELTVGIRRYGQLLAQVNLSEAYAVYRAADDEWPVAMAGIAPLGDVAGEIWFGVVPGSVGSTLLPMVRAARLILSARAADYPGGFMCLVQDDNEAGQRLAGMIGFNRCDVTFQGHREWSWKRLEGQRGICSEGDGWRGGISGADRSATGNAAAA